jgi:hypothetical protein
MRRFLSPTISIQLTRCCCYFVLVNLNKAYKHNNSVARWRGSSTSCFRARHYTRAMREEIRSTRFSLDFIVHRPSPWIERRFPAFGLLFIEHEQPPLRKSSNTYPVYVMASTELPCSSILCCFGDKPTDMRWSSSRRGPCVCSDTCPTSFEW